MRRPRNRDLRALGRRDPRAIEDWFLAHVDQIYTFAFYRVGKDPDLATDVVQETFITALDRIEQYDPERGGMTVWLMYLARNSIRTANRQRSRFQTGDEIWERIDARLVPPYLDMTVESLPSDALERQETAELVQMTLAHLPERYRWALVEHHVHQRSVQEMAERGEMTAGAVKSLLFRARKAFKAAFWAIGEELGACGLVPGRTR